MDPNRGPQLVPQYSSNGTATGDCYVIGDPNYSGPQLPSGEIFKGDRVHIVDYTVVNGYVQILYVDSHGGHHQGWVSAACVYADPRVAPGSQPGPAPYRGPMAPTAHGGISAWHG